MFNLHSPLHCKEKPNSLKQVCKAPPPHVPVGGCWQPLTPMSVWTFPLNGVTYHMTWYRQLLFKKKNVIAFLFVCVCFLLTWGLETDLQELALFQGTQVWGLGSPVSNLTGQCTGWYIYLSSFASQTSFFLLSHTSSHAGFFDAHPSLLDFNMCSIPKGPAEAEPPSPKSPQP